MTRQPPRSTRTDTLVPYTTLFRSPGRSVMALFYVRGSKRSAAPSRPPLGEWVPRFLDGFSIETLPQVAARTPSYGDLFPADTSVYIAFVPRSDWRDIVLTAKRLRAEGLNPVPHVPARTMEGKAELQRYLGRLAEDAGVTQVLAIGGDLPIPVGEFACAMDMLETGLFDRYGIRTIGIAGHPEGNNAIGDETILASLREKDRKSTRLNSSH